MGRWRVVVGLAFVALLVACGGDDRESGGDLNDGQDSAVDPNADAAVADGAMADGSMSMNMDPTMPMTDLAPAGGACNCDADCQGSTGNAAICVQGVCMNRPSAGTCSSPGSTAECPSGSQCWSVEGLDYPLCIPACNGMSCAGGCSEQGLCLPTQSNTCDTGCATICTDTSNPDGQCPPNASWNGMGCACDEGYVVNADRTACIEPCSADSCGEGKMCLPNGECIITPEPPDGPIPACTQLPDWRCSGSDCGKLYYFDPRRGPGYWDYPLNGETEQNQWRSYLQLQNIQVLKYASAATDCLAANWNFGNGGEIGLGDMSEANGAIPGTSANSPGHPQGTHVNGRDIDIGYFQTGTPDNKLRPVCAHISGGRDAYHCLGDPVYLDARRTAMYIGQVLLTGTVRVIGVDGRVGPQLQAAAMELCNAGWLPQQACTLFNQRVTWEATNTGKGWFYHHHHHFHISFVQR